MTRPKLFWMEMPAADSVPLLTNQSLPAAWRAAAIHGAGTSREYPIEKLYRDARVALIEDGENTILTMRLGVLAQQLYAEGWSQN